MIEASPFDIQTEVQNGLASVHMSGELDIGTLPRLQRAVDGVLGGGNERVLIDLSGLTFVDSSGLRLFILLNARATEEGWALSLTRPAGPPLAVFRLTGAEQNLPFEPEQETAA